MSCVSREKRSPAGAIRFSRPGRMCCTSTPFIRACAAQMQGRRLPADREASATGSRCDMAMLLENPDLRTHLGQPRGGTAGAQEYWVELIPAIKRSYPNFLFMAEAYWDEEWNLQQQGFDFCYDKRLYDRLEHGNPESVRLHLCAGDRHITGETRAVPRESRRTAGGRNVLSGKGASRGRHDRDSAGRQAFPRRSVRRPQGKTPGFPGQTAGGAPPIRNCWHSTGSCCPEPRRPRYFTQGGGASASGRGGPTIRVFRISSPGAGRRTNSAA